jgi:hypothetical protein
VVIFGPVCPVAAGTVQGEVRVSWILHIFPYGMGGVPLVFVTIRTDVHVGGRLEEVWVIGTVGRMTRVTFTFQDRFMFDL